MSTKKSNKIVPAEIVKPVSSNSRKDVITIKIAKWFKKRWQPILLFIGGLIIGIAIMFISGYGSIAKISNGDDLLVSVKGLDISANSLYSTLKKDYGMTSILAQIDDYILTDKYSEYADKAATYADDYITSLKSSYSDSWSDFLSYYGFADDAALKASLVQKYYSNIVTTEYVQNKITDAEIQSYYDSKVVGDIEVSHILVKADYATSATDDEITAAYATAKTTADDIIAQLKASTDVTTTFATLAKKYSDDSDTASAGGSLGYINATDYTSDTTFSDAAYALTNVGDYTTTAVKDTNAVGYEIIIKTGKDKTKADLADVKSSVIAAIVTSKVDADSSLAIYAMMNLRKEYNIKFEEPTMKATYDDLMATNVASAVESDSSSNS